MGVDEEVEENNSKQIMTATASTLSIPMKQTNVSHTQNQSAESEMQHDIGSIVSDSWLSQNLNELIDEVMATDNIKTSPSELIAASETELEMKLDPMNRDTSDDILTDDEYETLRSKFFDGETEQEKKRRNLLMIGGVVVVGIALFVTLRNRIKL